MIIKSRNSLTPAPASDPKLVSYHEIENALKSIAVMASREQVIDRIRGALIALQLVGIITNTWHIHIIAVHVDVSFQIKNDSTVYAVNFRI